MKSAQRADEVAVDRAYRGCPFAGGAPRLAWPAWDGAPGEGPAGPRHKPGTGLARRWAATTFGVALLSVARALTRALRSSDRVVI
jgi:hypothetical protein